jgi:hypothetical protein
MIARCEADIGQGNCEKYGLMYYPKCRPGFYPIGCCICRPPAPDCFGLGMNGNLDLSCGKKIIIGDPISMDCTNGQIYDAGLCYDKCQTGFYGIGPVCWKAPPSNWVECGMGAATDSKACTNVIFDQFASVGNMALSIATLGAGKAVKFAKDAAQTAKLRKQFTQIKRAATTSSALTNTFSAAQGQFPIVETGKNLGEALEADPSELTAEDIVRVSAQIAAILDPTGISDVIGAYTYPKCSKITV